MRVERESRNFFWKVQEINQNAVNFYFSNGFRVVGSEAFRVGGLAENL